MREIKGILEEYRGSDFKKRLDLYLEFRCLRREFDDIERREAVIEKALGFKSQENPARQVNSVFRSLLHSLKCRCSLLVQRLYG